MSKETPPPPPRASILLVDDREENLLALHAVLAPLDHQLVSVTSGAEALKEILLGEFACILLDVQMPELDGFELATLIKQRKRSQHIPIIFVTALSKEDTHVYRGCSMNASSPHSSAPARRATGNWRTRCPRSCGRRGQTAARRISTGGGSSTRA